MTVETLLNGRVAELERRNDELQEMYDRAVKRAVEVERRYDEACAALMDALNEAANFRRQASEHAFEADRQRTLADYRQQVNEKRSGAERRHGVNISEAVKRQETDHDLGRSGDDRRKSWPR
jgi:hypothetical protein